MKKIVEINKDAKKILSFLEKNDIKVFTIHWDEYAVFIGAMIHRMSHID